jgi:hypothetical protein
MGYRWVVRDGCQVQYWEGAWSGSAPLTVQFWELYYVCNEKSKTLAEVWAKGELRLSFCRTFSDQMLESWEEMKAVVEQVSLREEPDALIWGCERSGAYSSHSFYATINYRRVKPVNIPVV